VRKILHKFSVELPNKQGRGGQSANRLARIRDEKCTIFVRKVAEMATQCFITNDVINVRGLINAGCANYKTRLVESNLFDQRLRSSVISIIDVAYSGFSAFKESSALRNVRESLLFII
jgi:peptide chain release factor subunit 1